MRSGKGYFLTGLLCLVLLLSGCKSAKKISPADQPSTVRLTLLAEPNTNPNRKGEATPTEIAVVYLSDDSKLLAADYDQLRSKTLKKTLSKNYIDHQEYTLLPGQFKPVLPVDLVKNNSYLGVIAYYANANRSEWKKIIKINGVGHQYNVLIHVRKNEVELRKEEE
ncbi:type VI secretion system lipoprotein TssJ [Serratia aquatilis]|uniref:Type VI secretion system lipoprotein TssJ n=1 Tax=Serratia aquatilis TaxID=1737515 RepID=A0ABV6EI26_9GAMM